MINSAIIFLNAILWSFIVFYVVTLRRRFLVDCFRHRLFQLRGRLFLDAANGNFNFNSPAYALVRFKINTQIRYAHHVSPLKLLWLGLCFRASGEFSNLVAASERRAAKAWESLKSEDQRIALKSYIDKMHLEILFQFLRFFGLSGPLGYLVGHTFRFFAFAKKCKVRLVNDGAWKRYDSQAELLVA